MIKMSNDIIIGDHTKSLAKYYDVFYGLQKDDLRI